MRRRPDQPVPRILFPFLDVILLVLLGLLLEKRASQQGIPLPPIVPGPNAVSTESCIVLDCAGRTTWNGEPTQAEMIATRLANEVAADQAVSLFVEMDVGGHGAVSQLLQLQVACSTKGVWDRVRLVPRISEKGAP